METLKKLHSNFIQMLIRKCGIEISKDTESYLVIKSIKEGYWRFYLSIEHIDSDKEFQNLQETHNYIDCKLNLLAVFSSFDEPFNYYGIDSRAFTNIPENFKNRIGRNYLIKKNNWYILPDIKILNNDNLDVFFKIDNNGIRKYQSTGS